MEDENRKHHEQSEYERTVVHILARSMHTTLVEYFSDRASVLHSSFTNYVATNTSRCKFTSGSKNVVFFRCLLRRPEDTFSDKEPNRHKNSLS
jgi:hypothetical protein